jgi:adenosylcobinamide-phosphate guanylyltransferase
MLALIMAGGSGSRLNLGEKPLVLINGRPMIAYVIRAFEDAGHEPIVVTSPKTPMTRNWCHVQGISFHPASGNGYIEDMVEVVSALEEKQPLFVSVSDIPCLPSRCIREVLKSYRKSRKDACSAWVPDSPILTESGNDCFRETIDGIDAVPAGLNIILGEKIGREQAELKMLIHDPGLTINVNTRSDRIRAEEFLRTFKRD